MRIGTSSLRSPLNLLGLLLVLAGVVGLIRQGASPSAATGQACDPADAECVKHGATPLPSPQGRVADAAEACRDVGYLCAEVENVGGMTVRRWTGFEGTLVVHVPELRHEDRGLALQLQRAAAAGIRAWNGQPFPILVDERGTRDAHFSVHWSSALGGNRIGQAETRWSRATGLEVRRIVLATRSPFHPNASISPAQIRLTAAHEMGHALGLPHSDEPRDVMYPTNTASSLTTRDYKTLEALYALEDGLVIRRR